MLNFHSRLLGIAFAVTLAFGFIKSPVMAEQSAYNQPEVEWVHNVKVTDDTATLKAKYRCWGGNDNTHLWVSLKQGDEINKYTLEQLINMEGTSSIATSWYDSHPVDVVCDGKWQIQEFTVNREASWGSLLEGNAFFQFCLFDSQGGFGYLYDFVTVKDK